MASVWTWTFGSILNEFIENLISFLRGFLLMRRIGKLMQFCREVSGNLSVSKVVMTDYSPFVSLHPEDVPCSSWLRNIEQ